MSEDSSLRLRENRHDVPRGMTTVRHGACARRAAPFPEPTSRSRSRGHSLGHLGNLDPAYRRHLSLPLLLVFILPASDIRPLAFSSFTTLNSANICTLLLLYNDLYSSSVRPMNSNGIQRNYSFKTLPGFR